MIMIVMRRRLGVLSGEKVGLCTSQLSVLLFHLVLAFPFALRRGSPLFHVREKLMCDTSLEDPKPISWTSRRF